MTPQHDNLPPHSPASPPGTATGSSPCRLQPEVPTREMCLEHQHDWANLNIQFPLSKHLGTPQRDLLTVAMEKIKLTTGSSFDGYWAKQAAWQDYGSLASIIACSGYAKAEDNIHCGYSSYSCHDRLFCPRCCYNRMSRQVNEEFGDAFDADNEVYYIVFSLSSNPDETQRFIFKDVGNDEFHNLKHLGTTDGVTSHDYGLPFQEGCELGVCRILWNLYAEAIREFSGNKPGKLFSGVVGGPELALRLGPLRVLPHANYICWSPGLAADGVRKLRTFIRDKMRNCRRLKTKLFPSVACYRLRTSEDLRRVIGYIFKPIDLAAAYVSAAERVNKMAVELERLNIETNIFFKNVLEVFWHLPRVARYGRCSANHRDYFGHVSAYRLAIRERDAARRASPSSRKPRRKSKAQDSEWWWRRVLGQFEPPSRPCGSRFSYWKHMNERPPPRPGARTTLKPAATVFQQFAAIKLRVAAIQPTNSGNSNQQKNEHKP